MGADQFLLCKLNGDLLLGDEGIDCHGNGDDERPAQDYELGACAQIPEHCSCRGVSIFAWSQHDAPGAERHFSGAGVPFFPAGQHSSPQMAGLRKPKFGAHRRYLNKSQVIPVVPPAHRPEPADMSWCSLSIHNLDTAAKGSNRHLPHGLRADTQGWRDAMSTCSGSAASTGRAGPCSRPTNARTTTIN